MTATITGRRTVAGTAGRRDEWRLGDGFRQIRWRRSDGSGAASLIAAAASATAAAIQTGGDSRAVLLPSSSLQGGGDPRSGFPLPLSHASWEGHIKDVFSFLKIGHTRYSSSLPYIGERKRGVCPKGSPVIQGVWPKRMG